MSDDLEFAKPRSTGLQWKPFLIAGICVVFLFSGGCLTLLINSARQAAIDATRQGRAFYHLNELALALEQYHMANGHYPPAYVVDTQGKPLYSWRVLILPYMDASEYPDAARVYAAFDKDQAWDSAANRPMVAQMPMVYSKGEVESDALGYTNFAVVVGDETLFPGAHSRSKAEITDGEDTTITVVQVSPDQFHWSEPRDLEFNSMSFSVNDPSKRGPWSDRQNHSTYVAAVSCAKWGISPLMNPTLLRAMLTISGGESVDEASIY